MLNFKKLDEVISDSFTVLVDKFGQQQQEEIRSEKWDWPRTTYRKVGGGRTGLVANSPRDIVDTGKLLNSLDIKFVNPTYAVYYWQTQYAIFVLMGVRYSNGTEAPGRNWIESAMEEYQLVENFVSILKDNF